MKTRLHKGAHVNIRPPPVAPTPKGPNRDSESRSVRTVGSLSRGRDESVAWRGRVSLLTSGTSTRETSRDTILFTWHSRKGKAVGTEEGPVVASGLRRAASGLTEVAAVACVLAGLVLPGLYVCQKSLSSSLKGWILLQEIKPLKPDVNTQSHRQFPHVIKYPFININD